MSRPMDTARAADTRQLEGLRAMSPAARLRLADAMSTDVAALARSGIRARHPDYSTEEVDAALANVLLGRSLASVVRRSRRPVSGR